MLSEIVPQKCMHGFETKSTSQNSSPTLHQSECHSAHSCGQNHSQKKKKVSSLHSCISMKSLNFEIGGCNSAREEEERASEFEMHFAHHEYALRIGSSRSNLGKLFRRKRTGEPEMARCNVFRNERSELRETLIINDLISSNRKSGCFSNLETNSESEYENRLGTRLFQPYELQFH